jgi:hypothetical protein
LISATRCGPVRMWRRSTALVRMVVSMNDLHISIGWKRAGNNVRRRMLHFLIVGQPPLPSPCASSGTCMERTSHIHVHVYTAASSSCWKAGLLLLLLLID